MIHVHQLILIIAKYVIMVILYKVANVFHVLAIVKHVNLTIKANVYRAMEMLSYQLTHAFNVIVIQIV